MSFAVFLNLFYFKSTLWGFFIKFMNWKNLGWTAFWRTSRWLLLRFERLQQFSFWTKIKSILAFYLDKNAFRLLHFTRFNKVWRNLSNFCYRIYLTRLSLTFWPSSHETVLLKTFCQLIIQIIIFRQRRI